MKTRRILFSAVTILVLLAIAACMMVIGRGHTIYFDNKNLEVDGEKYEAIRRINVNVNGEQVAKLSKKERGMATCMGQTFKFNLEVIREKGGDSEFYDYTLKLPYGIDGIVVNLPGILEGLPQEAWMSEFIPAPTVEEEEETPAEGELDDGLDEFDMGGDL